MAPIAIDETRYLTVGWEMFSGGDWLVPHLNGDYYTHKPPLLFWLIDAGWRFFGVNAWWPRLVPQLAGFAAWLVLWRLARRLWPQVEDVSPFAVILAGGTLVWSLTGTLIMFDMLLALWVLVGMLGLARAGDGEGRGWLLFGVGLGLDECIDIGPHPNHRLRRLVHAQHRQHAADRLQLRRHRDQQVALGRVPEVPVDFLFDLRQRAAQRVTRPGPAA